MGIGKRLKEAREHAGLTQEELAKKIGITGSAITNYEKETSHPKEPVLYALINVLKIEPNFLFQDCVSTINLKKLDNFLSNSESEHIKKYRTLDEYGKEAVDGVLETEHRRCKEQREKTVPLPDENVLPLRCSTQAASAGTGCYLGPEEWDQIGRASCRERVLSHV